MKKFLFVQNSKRDSSKRGKHEGIYSVRDTLESYFIFWNYASSHEWSRVISYLNLSLILFVDFTHLKLS